MIQNATLTTLLLPGNGTTHDLRNAHVAGARWVCIATPCTEPDAPRQPIEAARCMGMDVSGFLIMSHMIRPADLAQQAKKMESYGAHCVYSNGLAAWADFFNLMDAADDLGRPLQDRPVQVEGQTLSLGYAGVYSSFLRHAEKAATQHRTALRPALS